MVQKTISESKLPFDEVNVFDADNSELRTLKHAGSHWLPGMSGGPCSAPTVYRYASEGSHGVVLKTISTSRSTLTTEAACKEFIRNVDAVRKREKKAAGVVQASDSELRKLGLK